MLLTILLVLTLDKDTAYRLWTILGPFLNGDLSRMPKLIQIVLQTPMLPLLQGIVDADLVCTAMAAEYSTISPSGLQKMASPVELHAPSPPASAIRIPLRLQLQFGPLIYAA